MNLVALNHKHRKPQPRYIALSLLLPVTYLLSICLSSVNLLRVKDYQIPIGEFHNMRLLK